MENATIEAISKAVEADPASDERMLEPSKPPSAGVAGKTAPAVGVRAMEKNLVLESEYIGPIPKTTHTDRTRLRQILVNVVGNAIKFTDTGNTRFTARGKTIEVITVFDPHLRTSLNTATVT